MDKSKLLSVLDKFNFVVEKSEVFSVFDEEFIYCVNKNNNISIVIKKYKEFSEENILEDVLKARGLLRENNINIWNSYYLILFSNPKNLLKTKPNVYSIERNSKGLRKYVVLNEDDLYRIPFIKPDQINRANLDFQTNFMEILNTDDSDISKIIRWIMESDGDLIEIKKRTIKEKISEIYNGSDFVETQ